MRITHGWLGKYQPNESINRKGFLYDKKYGVVAMCGKWINDDTFNTDIVGHDINCKACEIIFAIERNS